MAYIGLHEGISILESCRREARKIASSSHVLLAAESYLGRLNSVSPRNLAMASLHTRYLFKASFPYQTPKTHSKRGLNFLINQLKTPPESYFLEKQSKEESKKKANSLVVNSLAEELDVIPVQSESVTRMQEGFVVSRVKEGGPSFYFSGIC